MQVRAPPGLRGPGRAAAVAGCTTHRINAIATIAQCPAAHRRPPLHRRRCRHPCHPTAPQPRRWVPQAALDAIGERVGRQLIERYARDRPPLLEQLDAMKVRAALRRPGGGSLAVRCLSEGQQSEGEQQQWQAWTCLRQRRCSKLHLPAPLPPRHLPSSSARTFGARCSARPWTTCAPTTGLLQPGGCWAAAGLLLGRGRPAAGIPKAYPAPGPGRQAQGPAGGCAAVNAPPPCARPCPPQGHLCAAGHAVPLAGAAEPEPDAGAGGAAAAGARPQERAGRRLFGAALRPGARRAGAAGLRGQRHRRRHQPAAGAPLGAWRGVGAAAPRGDWGGGGMGMAALLRCAVPA